MNKRDHKYLGWLPDLPDSRDFSTSLKVSRASQLPVAIDLRSQLRNIPIINQGSLGSCTACAISTAHMASQIIEEKKLDIIPSKLFIYYNERAMEGSVNYDSGAMIRDGIKSLVRQGVCSESDWPYIISKFKNKPSLTAYRNALNFQALIYERLRGHILTELLSVLAQGYPFIFGFTVYDSFDSQKVARTGLYVPDTAKESILGGHAVICFGYDQPTQMFLVRNSWGSNWGIGGYFKMRFADMINPNLCDDFWVLRKTE